MSFSCLNDKDIDSPTDKTKWPVLEFISKVKIDVPEPSGLTFDPNNDVLYTVSDHTNNIYKISKKGDILKEYNLNSSDLEGITIYKSNLLVVDEKEKQIIKYNATSSIITRHLIDYETTMSNSGFEGIAYNKDKNVFYVLNEKKPGQLITVDINYKIINTVDLNFAVDYSGIFYDTKAKYLWIVSDQSSTLNICSLIGELIKSYSIDIDKCEGVAIDNKLGYMYFVSDSKEELYTYKIK